MSIARGGGKGTRGKSSKNFNSTDNASKTHRNKPSCTISSHRRPSSHTRPPHFHRVDHLPPIPPTGPHGPPPPHSRAASRCLATNSCAAAGLRTKSAVPLTPSSRRSPAHAPHSPNQCCVVPTPFPHQPQMVKSPLHVVVVRSSCARKTSISCPRVIGASKALLGRRSAVCRTDQSVSRSSPTGASASGSKA